MVAAGDIAERLARIETKLDALLVRDDDHERRLRFLESLDLSTLKENEKKRSDDAGTTRRLVYLAFLTALVLPLVAALLYHSFQVSS